MCIVGGNMRQLVTSVSAFAQVKRSSRSPRPLNHFVLQKNVPLAHVDSLFKLQKRSESGAGLCKKP